MNRTHQTFSAQEKDKLLREVENSLSRFRRLDAGCEKLDEFGAIGTEGVKGR